MTRFLVVFACVLVTSCAHQATSDSASLATTEPKWLDNINRKVFKFNDSVDRNVLVPLAKAYKAITPDPIEQMVDNFFDNLAEPVTLVNSILQGKVSNSVNTLGRLIHNTTLGIGGLFDVASLLDIENDQEDFGQTLAVWGVNSGNYVVVPFLGGVTLRDGFGNIADGYITPLNYYDDTAIRYSLTGLNLLSIRAQLLGVEQFQGGDYYEFRKQIYLQIRDNSIRDGRVTIEEDNLDWLDDEL